MPIPIIDLFAGPGGLGEGFSAVTSEEGKRKFKIKLSVEKDGFAHQTLLLRSFFRSFEQVPTDYYLYLAGKISRAELFAKHPTQARNAAFEAWKSTLGSEDAPTELVDSRISAVLRDAKKWILIGGPPCQAYSLVGRSRIIGEKGVAAYDLDERHELYRHYLRILAKHQPPVFVMENVKGLLSARVKEQLIFEKILKDLRRPHTALPDEALPGARVLEYRLVPLCANRSSLLEFAPEDFLLQAEQYGIPQARHRIIILGIRSDLPARAHSMTACPSAVSIESVISDLPKLRSGLSREVDDPVAWRLAVRSIASAPWLNHDGLSPEVRQGILNAVRTVHADLSRGGSYMPVPAVPQMHKEWYFDARVGGVCNHESRSHIREDLHRYLFAAVYAEKTGFSPRLQDFPPGLLPNHKNVGAALKEPKFNDRFRVQAQGRPSTTVVSHIAKDGHYFIHYDQSQCRSLTVREAARLQTFPDNYYFEGPRTEQYKQVGNAVPPLLAKQIAEVVAKILE